MRLHFAIKKDGFDLSQSFGKLQILLQNHINLRPNVVSAGCVRVFHIKLNRQVQRVVTTRKNTAFLERNANLAALFDHHKCSLRTPQRLTG